MKLKNVLIVTEDIERSKKFYRDLFWFYFIYFTILRFFVKI